MAFNATRNMQFSLVLQKLSSFKASSEIFNIVLFTFSYISNYWIQYSVIYEPIEFQIPASAFSAILHISTACRPESSSKMPLPRHRLRGTTTVSSPDQAICPQHCSALCHIHSWLPCTCLRLSWKLWTFCMNIDSARDFLLRFLRQGTVSVNWNSFL